MDKGSYIRVRLIHTKIRYMYSDVGSMPTGSLHQPGQVSKPLFLNAIDLTYFLKISLFYIFSGISDQRYIDQGDMTQIVIAPTPVTHYCYAN